MRKKILAVIGIAAFAAVVAFNINTGLENDDPVDVTLDEVEGLSSPDLDNDKPLYTINRWCAQGSQFNFNPGTACTYEVTSAYGCPYWTCMDGDDWRMWRNQK